MHPYIRLCQIIFNDEVDFHLSVIKTKYRDYFTDERPIWEIPNQIREEIMRSELHTLKRIPWFVVDDNHRVVHNPALEERSDPLYATSNRILKCTIQLFFKYLEVAYEYCFPQEIIHHVDQILDQFRGNETLRELDIHEEHWKIVTKY